MNRLASQTYIEDLQSVCEENLPFDRLKHCRILVTGGTGLIGSCLVDTFLYLKKIKHIPLKIDLLCRNKKRAEVLFSEYLTDEDFRILEGDMTGALSFADEYDYIIHGAGNNHPVAFAREPVETMKAAMLGTISLLDGLAGQKEKKNPVFLLFSTGEVYGKPEKSRDEGCTEADMGSIDSMNPRSCYPEAKRAAEALCVAYAKEYGIRTKIARLCYVFGATWQEESTKADVQFLKKAVSGEDIVMKSAGSQYRSYCYLRDAVSGIFFVLLRGADGEVYNIANATTNVTIRQFAETLAEVAGVQVKFENPEDIEKQGYSQLSRELLNAHKLEKLGYTAKTDLREAFRRILNIRRKTV